MISREAAANPSLNDDKVLQKRLGNVFKAFTEAAHCHALFIKLFQERNVCTQFPLHARKYILASTNVVNVGCFVPWYQI